jgi:hypothetical protein
VGERRWESVNTKKVDQDSEQLRDVGREPIRQMLSNLATVWALNITVSGLEGTGNLVASNSSGTRWEGSPVQTPFDWSVRRRQRAVSTQSRLNGLDRGSSLSHYVANIQCSCLTSGPVWTRCEQGGQGYCWSLHRLSTIEFPCCCLSYLCLCRLVILTGAKRMSFIPLCNGKGCRGSLLMNRGEVEILQ